MTPIVVKLGGSTAYHAEMRKWVSVLVGSGRPLVIVPGGGPFANRVREAQREMGFSNQAAHFMAILAMDQMGLALVEMDERLTAVRTLEEINGALGAGKLPVWLPYQLCSKARGIPQSWDMTSDSLAAWIAGRLGAKALLLIKQTEAFGHTADIEELVTSDIVDPLLPVMMGETALYLAGPGSLVTAGERLAEGDLPGKRFFSRTATQRGAA
jgi:5-(aminomethyl)-3-furanmethanol phosphate kinase